MLKLKGEIVRGLVREGGVVTLTANKNGLFAELVTVDQPSLPRDPAVKPGLLGWVEKRESIRPSHRGRLREEI